MKKILVVLAGFFCCLFHTSVWADCGEEHTARFLSPGSGSVLINGAPFVLQWQDNSRCLGKRIQIDMIRESDGKRVRQIQANAENSGYFEITRVRAPVTHQADRYQFRIKSSRQKDSQIESKPFTMTNVGVPGGKDDEGIKFAPYISIRDALTRVTALEEFVEMLTTQVTGGLILQPEWLRQPGDTSTKKPSGSNENFCWDPDLNGWTKGDIDPNAYPGWTTKHQHYANLCGADQLQDDESTCNGFECCRSGIFIESGPPYNPTACVHIDYDNEVGNSMMEGELSFKKICQWAVCVGKTFKSGSK